MVENPPRTGATERAAAAGVLLIISASQNTAKRIESHLRNAGHPLRAAWVADLEELEDGLRRAAPDIVLCEQDLPDAPHAEAIALCARLAPDLPVVLLAGRATQEDTAAVLAAGARDLVSADDPTLLKHLECVCVRECANHRHMRELRKLRLQLTEFEARHRHLLAGTADAVARVQEGILSRANPAFAELLGYPSPEDLQSLPLMDLVAPADQAKAKQHFKQLQRGKIEGGELAITFTGRGGKPVAARAMLSRGEENGEAFVEMLIRAAPQAVAQNAPDASGRLALFERLEGVLASRPEQPHELLLVKIDDFRSLEERLGFRDVEQLATTLLGLLQARLSGQESLYRFSTDEFAAIVARPQPELEELPESLRKDIAAQVFKTASYEAHATVTLVAYPLGAQAQQAGHVVVEAASEMRRLSGASGNRVGMLGPTARAAQAEREEARRVDLVKKALAENRLKLAYQSIVSLEGDVKQLFDVFVRLLDEAGNEMQAREFLPTAEKHGLMTAIDRWVVGRALKTIAKRAGGQEGASGLFVRLSEDTVKEAEGFFPWFCEQMKPRPLQKGELIVEIREPILLNHIRKGKTLAKALADLKVEIAIDYFGTSNNSAPLLDHVPPAFVKFHPAFTQAFNDPARQKKMSELMEIARQRNIKTIVSNVEDANAMARLWQMGVNYVQGHSVQEPEVVLLAADAPAH